MFQPSSPTRRRESTPLLEKLKTDVAAARIKILTAMDKGKEPEKKPEKPREELAIQKYVRMQVSDPSHIDLNFTGDTGG